jgi:superfamily II DNA or RNA helicase
MKSLKDLLGGLTYHDACRLLGRDGSNLILKGGRWDIRIDEQVELSADQFLLDLGDIRVGITAADDSSASNLRLYCSRCLDPCLHMGAALALILEEKSALGLEPQEPRIGKASVAEQDMTRRALAERQARARTEHMTMISAEPDRVWTDYSVTNQSSGRTYRVALRGIEPGESFCSCPDYRKNTLGTCKHILFVLGKIQETIPDIGAVPAYRRDHFCVTIRYGKTAQLVLLPPHQVHSQRLMDEVMPLAEKPVTRVRDLLRALQVIEQENVEVVVYPDAEDFIDRLLFLDQIRSRVEEVRATPDEHPLRRELLKKELLPFQLDGIAFAVGAGRAILADEMGLGKTVQGIGVAALLDREVGLQKTLVICPTSLKYQWEEEIRRFSDYSCQVIEGTPESRRQQYGEAFFTLCNYEQVLRDIDQIEQVTWDLIILDEGQRIKNWEAKTARIVKGLKSPYALVLTGTPLETRLDELYSIVEFIDDRILGPAFAFFETYQVLDENGRVIGYRNLDRLREQLQPIMLRRTRGSVTNQLPERQTETILIEPSPEQLELHDRHRQTIAAILGRRSLSEMDLMRLRKALPTPQRHERLERFREDPDCRLLISTNPGAFGLNLQCADTVINLDIPWTPAVLEQRISRVHRMGQRHPVQVFLLVTAGTIEDNLLRAYEQKQQLAVAALDPDSEIDEIRVGSRRELIREKLKLLITPGTGAAAAEQKKDAKAALSAEAETGRLLLAAIDFLSPFLEPASNPERAGSLGAQKIFRQLQQSATLNKDGSINLNVKLPNANALQRLADVLFAYRNGKESDKVNES